MSLVSISSLTRSNGSQVRYLLSKRRRGWQRAAFAESFLLLACGASLYDRLIQAIAHAEALHVCVCDLGCTLVSWGLRLAGRDLALPQLPI